jgi:hypothetical protein
MFFHRRKEAEEVKTDSANPAPVFQAPKEAQSESSAPNPVNIVVTTKTEETSGPKKESRAAFAVKIVTALLALSALGTACYSVYALIHDKAYSADVSESYLTLTGKNFGQSQAVYAAFGTADKTHTNQRKIKDFAFLGSKMFLSVSKITPSLLSVADREKIVGTGAIDLYLYNLTDDVAKGGKDYGTDTANGKFSIDLSKVNEGDYLIYPEGENAAKTKAEIYPFSINTEESIREVFYTLPDKDGKRKRITFKDNSVSPYLLLSVQSCGTTLPDTVYDAVLLDQEFTGDPLSDQGKSASDRMSTLSAIAQRISANRYKIKAVDSLVSAHSVQATVSLALSSSLSQDFLSVYNTYGFSGYQAKALDSGDLIGYDAYPEIRELTGYLDRAGEGYAGVIANDVLAPVTSKQGKESFLVGSSGRDETALDAALSACLERF